jgi:hypothetical protein
LGFFFNTLVVRFFPGIHSISVLQSQCQFDKCTQSPLHKQHCNSYSCACEIRDWATRQISGGKKNFHWFHYWIRF